MQSAIPCTNLTVHKYTYLFWNDNQTCTLINLSLFKHAPPFCALGACLTGYRYRRRYLSVSRVYMMIQHLCDLVSPTTSLVFPENRGTVPELGDSESGFSCTGISCFVTSGIELMLWLFVEFKLFSTGLPFVLI